MPSGVYKRTEYHRNAFKVPHRPHKRQSPSKETKDKISLGLQGDKNWNYGKMGQFSHSWKGGFDRKKYNKESLKNNYEKKLWHNRKRRIMKTGNGGSHTLGDWETLKAQYNWTCPCCKKVEPQIKLTEDHIIPVSKGGSDNIENIQPLCKSCNCRKHDKIKSFIC